MSFQSFYNTIFSIERLEAFRIDTNEPEKEAIARYLWNVALCESLYPSLHMLEVVLRNRVHYALAPHFSEDWLMKKGKNACLREPEQQDVSKVISRIIRDRKSVTPGRVVAGLNLGFWVFLLSRHYDFIFWRKNLRAVFPNLSKKNCNRKALHAKLLRAWHLRNRVSHHEPIWNKKFLMQDYETILFLIKALSPDALPLLKQVDRFPSVYESGHSEWIDKA